LEVAAESMTLEWDFFEVNVFSVSGRTALFFSGCDTGGGEGATTPVETFSGLTCVDDCLRDETFSFSAAFSRLALAFSTALASAFSRAALCFSRAFSAATAFFAALRSAFS